MTIELTSQFIFGGAILALLCVSASLLSNRFGAPILLVFLILGMLAGEDGPGGVLFNDTELAFLLGNLALAIIIFDGGLGARRDSFRVSLRPALSLATFGVIITSGLVGVAAMMILQLPWQSALLIGAIVGSTDAAAVFGLLRSAGLELNERTGATLEIESGTNDPMAIFLTVTLVEILTSASSAPGLSVLSALAKQLGWGLLIGFAGGYALVVLLKRLSLPASLFPLFTLAGALSVFGATNLFGGSGFLAIYIVGVITGNASLPYGNDIHRFHDGMAWLSQIGMFLMLGLLITPSHMIPIIIPATAIALILIFIARPIAVMLSLLPFRFPWREQIFISWCGLRGAVPIILALFPSLAGLEQNTLIFELVFFVVLISLILQGWTIAPVARFLGIDLPPGNKESEYLKLPIPNEQNQALMLYRVIAGSRLIGILPKQLPLIQGGQLLSVIRQGVVINPDRRQEIRADDYVVILATPEAAAALSGKFVPDNSLRQEELSDYFGNFIISPVASVRELATLYGFEVHDDQWDKTVGELLNKAFHNKAVVGDRIKLGHVQFVVKSVVDQKIASIGLKFEQR